MSKTTDKIPENIEFAAEELLGRRLISGWRCWRFQPHCQLKLDQIRPAAKACAAYR
jgi:hypothetical protein